MKSFVPDCMKEPEVVTLSDGEDEEDDEKTDTVVKEADFEEEEKAQNGKKGNLARKDEKLAVHGLQLAKMELYSADGAGQTVFFSDRGNKQLESDYVPNDPRNLGGTTVPFLIDGTEKMTSSGLDTEMLEKAMGLTETKVKDCLIERKYIAAINVTSSVENLKKTFIKSGFSKIIVK